ncbi:hypothetical protein L3X38_026168 [Prunus dulcis]|uniref:Uncharacterized protein n=1 Tax=Prunus dulcis TaxID=3755 RepID=A0AAD4W4P4_PRUDU|nr:hypothetical protein L3X38_026168 [Prunus dulcis]
MARFKDVMSTAMAVIFLRKSIYVQDLSHVFYVSSTRSVATILFKILIREFFNCSSIGCYRHLEHVI